MSFALAQPREGDFEYLVDSWAAMLVEGPGALEWEKHTNMGERHGYCPGSLDIEKKQPKQPDAYGSIKPKDETIEKH